MTPPTVQDLLDRDQPLAGPEPSAETDAAAPSSSGGWDWSRLMARSPDAPIESYQDHPINFDRSLGLAQLIRGLEGVLGSLNYALVDIALGLLRWLRGRRREVPQGDGDVAGS